MKKKKTTILISISIAKTKFNNTKMNDLNFVVTTIKVIIKKMLQQRAKNEFYECILFI